MDCRADQKRAGPSEVRMSRRTIKLARTAQSIINQIRDSIDSNDGSINRHADQFLKAACGCIDSALKRLSQKEKGQFATGPLTTIDTSLEKLHG